MKSPELLAPAGDLQKAYYAFRYGADAVYCGVPEFSLRTRANYFSEQDIEQIVCFARENNKKVYVTVNNFPHQRELENIKKHLKFLAQVKPDGIIISDVGVLSLANELVPKVAKHLSVQATTLNSRAVKFWQNNHISRVILAREVSLSEIVDIKKSCPTMEVEIFVHGAMCMSYSGRCLLSNYLTGRDANRGDCAHCCRWNYKIYNQDGGEISLANCKEKNVNQSIHNFEKTQYWEEELRPNEFMRAEEDWHGTHIMSSRDMCMIEHLKDIVEVGVCSLKIEGRNKTIYYLATVCRAYRKALDDLKKGKKFDEKLLDEINTVFNRGFFCGFLKGAVGPKAQQYEANITRATHEIVGVAKEIQNGKLRFEVRNRIDEGDEIEFVFPDFADDFKVRAKNLLDVRQNETVLTTSLHGGAGDGWMDCERQVAEGIIMRKKL